MITLVPANGIAQLNAVFDRIDLTWDEKALLACLIARLYAAQSSLPIPTLALTLRKPVEAILSTAVSLRRHSYIKIQTQDDGQHAVLNEKHPLFEIRIRSGALDRVLATTGKVPTSGMLLNHWRTCYHTQFKKFPERDQKDLLRMRYIVKRQKEEAMQAVQDYVTRHRNLPQKCTTLGLFLSYGQTKKV